MALLEKVIENSFVRVASGLFDTLAEGNEKALALTEGRGYLSYPYADLDCLRRCDELALASFWPVLKTNLGARDPAFWPYNPGKWSSTPASDEFAAIMKQYIRIVPYKV
jgi:hypothetical protein